MGLCPEFEDLVQELDQFERDAILLKERIARFMDNARLAAGNATASETDAGGNGHSENGRTDAEAAAS